MLKLVLSFCISALLCLHFFQQQAFALQEVRIHVNALEACFCDLPIWGNDGEASRAYIREMTALWFQTGIYTSISLLVSILLLAVIVFAAYIHLAYAAWQVQHGRQ